MLAALLAGCGVKTVGDLDDGSESGDSSAEGSDGHTSVVSQTASDSDSATGEESSASMSTTDPSTSTTDPTDTETDSGECPPGPGSICDPQPEIEPDDAVWTIDDNIGFEGGIVDTPCSVADFQDDGTTMTIELHCDEEELAAHTIVVPSNPITPLNLGVGTDVRLFFYVQHPFWAEYWFALKRMDGSLILGGMEASALPDVDDLYAPLTMSLRDDVCPQECIIDECGATERHALDVIFGDDETTVYDRTVGTIGQNPQYTVVVGDASGFVDFPECTDIPGAWYRVIVYDSSEG